jgi:DMSO/TMAO reductase YedYZ molybdopterin-dependent catalytic subunit
MAVPRVELAAVNQCSGNSRGLFLPRVAGAQWAHGAMGNAKWTGVRLRDVLDLAGVKAGAVDVRFNGLDEPVVPDAPDFMKSLHIDYARDGEVMIAYAMNGEQLPLLNGFPLRLVFPGWYSTYWVKMLSDIEVLDEADDNYWTTTAYTIPDTPYANITPGQTASRPCRSAGCRRARSSRISQAAPRCLQGVPTSSVASPSAATQASPGSSCHRTAANRGARPGSGPTTANTASVSGKRT